MGDSHPGLRYRADLQGLRALAIALVVLAHAGLPGLAGGFVGVDVFFVLSGYLISGLLLRERIATGHIRFLDFIARRLRRLLPALLTMLVTTTGLGLVLLSGHEFSEQTASVAYAATWTSNLYFALTTFDYFAELHLRDLFLHTWSLGVEEQFYLVWPLLTWLAVGLAERPHAQSVSSPQRASRRRRLLMSTAAVFAASLALSLSLYWSATNGLWAFYLTPSRVWQFALGAAVFIWFEVDRDAADPVHVRSPAAWYGVQWGGIAVIAGSAVLLSPAVVYPVAVGVVAQRGCGDGDCRRLRRAGKPGRRYPGPCAGRLAG